MKNNRIIEYNFLPGERLPPNCDGVGSEYDDVLSDVKNGNPTANIASIITIIIKPTIYNIILLNFSLILFLKLKYKYRYYGYITKKLYSQIMTTRNKYISIGEMYWLSFKSKSLLEKIKFALRVIRYNIDDRYIYHYSYQIESYLDKIIKTEYDLYSIEYRQSLISLTSFLKDIPKDYIEYEEYYDNEVRYSEKWHKKFIKMDTFLEDFNKLIQNLEYIISSFDYNYQEMNEKGEKFYMELSKYVHNPARIEKISNTYNMEFDTYLDAIDL